MASHLCEIGLPTILTVSFTISSAALISLTIYRLYFHPLAKFPGPRLAAATYWYEAYYELVHKGGSQYTSKIRELHAEYGPIIRINPEEISVNDARFHEKLYAPQPVVRDRHPNFSALLGTTSGSFSTSDHYLHRKRRLAYSSFFASSNVKASERLVKKKVDHLCDLLWSHKENSSTLDIQTCFTALSFDSFFTWAFGSTLNFLDDLAFAEQCRESVETLVTSAPFYRIFPLAMGFTRRIPLTLLRRISRHIARVYDLYGIIFQTAEQLMEDNHSGPSSSYEEDTNIQPESLFSVIRRSNIPDSEKTTSRMSQEGVEMFMASFTPGRTMMLGMYYLHSNPLVLDTLRKELDQARSNLADPLSFRKLDTIPYLRAVMKEILRITFPVGSRLPLICHEEIRYEGFILPPHTSISVNHRNLLFDPHVFDDPLKFNPARWLDNRKPINEKQYFVVFGKGGRGCPGKEFATQLIQFTLATLIERFEFQLVDTIWGRDVAIYRESLLTAPAFRSQGVKLKLVGLRGQDLR